MSVQLDPYQRAIKEGKTISVELLKENDRFIVRKTIDYSFSEDDEKWAKEWYEQCGDLDDDE